MTQRPIARGLTLVLAGGLACLACGCSLMRPEGSGGLSDTQRQEELAKAAALAASGGARHPQPVSETAAPEPHMLDLATALTLADRNNRSIEAANAGVEGAAGDVAIARSALLPAPSVHGYYNWYSEQQTSAVNVTLPDGTKPVVTVREQDFGTIDAAVKLAIDLSGELRHGLYASQASYRAEQARAWATRLEEERAVTSAYFGLLEAKQLRAVAERTVALHQRQLEDATARFDQGRITRNNVLVVDVALTTSKQSLLILDNQISSARRSLNRATGLDVDAPTEARDVAGRPSLPPMETAVAEARAKNPLVTAMLEETRAADERLTSAKRGRFPKLSANGGYDATTASTLQPNNYGYVGATVDMDLYSFRREGEIDRLEAGSRRTKLMLDRSTREIEQMVRDAHDRVRERIAAIDAASVAVGQAEENLRIRRVQFEEGRATSEDVLDAAEIDTRQRAALAAAIYQAHARRAELQQLMGDPLAELEEVQGSSRPDVKAPPLLPVTPGAPAPPVP